MARIRTIKPEFPHSESMGRVSRDARLLFVSLWTICDDLGRARGASRILASLLFPYDDDAPTLIDGWLGELEREGCVWFYDVGSSRYVQVANWLNHQRIDKPSGAKCPDPREGSRVTREHSSGDRDRDRDRDRSTGPGPGSGGEHEGNRAPRSADEPPTKRKPAARAIPPDWTPIQRHQTLADECGVDLATEAAKYVDHATANARRLVDWHAGFANWLRNAQKFGGHRGGATRQISSPASRTVDACREVVEAIRRADQQAQGGAES